MNRIHRLVFNPCTGACQAVPEVAASSHAGAPGAEGRPTGLPRRTRLATACLIALGALASTGSWAQDTYGPLTGAPGANGVFQLGTGTSGGAGSAAFEATASGFHYDALTGGQGGAGGPGIARGGNGGSGGAGLISHAANVVLFNAGTMTGGQGGTGGSGITRGAGGAGGTGAALDAPATLLNDSLISGGRGGNPGAIGGGNPAIAEGGVGVTATGGTSIENGGTISGGLSGNGLVRADAIRFTGDYNWLGLLSTSVIQGNVVASPSQNDTLALVGTADGSFDASLIGPAAQYRNFAAFQKLGTSTWTLTGATAALTPWYLNAGTLAIATDASLGDVAGALTLDGGALRTTADITSSRAIVLGASQGTLDIEGGTTYTANTAVTGAGGLTKAGNGILRLTADNTYTGGTTIAAGTLQLGDGGTAGSITGDVANEGTLAFNRSDATSFAGTISAAGRVEQRGSGTTTLTAANTYSGGTAITAGTLQLGDGGTAGSLTGDVINQGTLAFNRSDATTFAGTISGAGRVEQRGTGMTTLTAANTYSGGTAITAGTLQLGDGGTTGSIAGDVVNQGTLAFNRSDATSFAGTISGAGRVEQRGTGMTTLTAANTYSGGTAITAGTLQLGDGGTAGSIAGDVANQGALAFNRSDATTFAGTISGAGRVEQRGTGMTTLTAANTYSGGTAITAGTLAGSAASLGSGAILNNAALVIDQAQDAALGNAISGSGSLTKTGAGALELRGGSAAFAGNTQVASGTLAVSGALGGALTVGSGARLSGTGTVGTTTVQSGATLAPGSGNGNGLGTLNVAGSLTLASGSRYQINALGDGQSDALRVSGAAALQGGNVEVLASGAWNPSTRYSIVTAGGGVSGQFGGVSTNMAFLEPLLSYSPGSVTLRLQRNDVTFQDVAQTPNQRAAAGGVAGLHTGPLYSAVVQLNAADARSAFDALSGEAHASLKSAAIEDSRFVRDAGLARARTAFEPSGAAPEAPAGAQGGVWAQAFDSWGSDDGDANASLTSRSARGLFLGADTRTGNDWRLGVLGGYSRSRLTLDNRASGVTGDTYHVGVYGGRQWGALGVRAGASYSAGKADTRRSIAFTGVNSLSTASYDVSTTQVFGELGWRLPTPNGAIEPFAGLAHVHLRTDAFSETGGLAALSAGKSSSDTTYSTLGVRATRSLDMAGVSGSLRGSVGWRHAYGDVKPSATLAFAGQNGFTTVGAAVAKNAIVLEGGIDFALQRNLTLGVSYVGQAGSNMNDHGIKASLLWKF